MLLGDNPLGFAGGTITQQLPAAWDDVLPAFRGTVRYTRRFGKPTNIEPRERVWLCLEAAAGRIAVQLNGAPLATPRADVTELLRERNLLLIEVTQLDSTQPAGLVGEVRLEICVGPAPPGE